VSISFCNTVISLDFSSNNLSLAAMSDSFSLKAIFFSSIINSAWLKKKGKSEKVKQHKKPKPIYNKWTNLLSNQLGLSDLLIIISIHFLVTAMLKGFWPIRNLLEKGHFLDHKQILDGMKLWSDIILCFGHILFPHYPKLNNFSNIFLGDDSLFTTRWWSTFSSSYSSKNTNGNFSSKLQPYHPHFLL